MVFHEVGRHADREPDAATQNNVRRSFPNKGRPNGVAGFDVDVGSHVSHLVT